MIILVAAIVVAALAVVSYVGARMIERAYPPSGRFVDVDGGRLHILEMGRHDAPPVVLLHGASGNLNDLRLALGERLAARYRVIIVDRPGHGWSDRPEGAADASPGRQAAIIHQALARMGVTRPIILGQSWSGALATAYALAFPSETAGLVLLCPVTHPWPGGIGWFNWLVSTPFIGPLVAYTMIVPAGYFLLPPGVTEVFAPQVAPDGYIENTAAWMILRPSEFIANAQDIAVLKDFVTAQAPHYGEIKAPVAIIAGDADETVYTDIHSRAIAAQLPHAKLTVLPGVGHMVQYAATNLVVQAVDEVATAAGY